MKLFHCEILLACRLEVLAVTVFLHSLWRFDLFLEHHKIVEFLGRWYFTFIQCLVNLCHNIAANGPSPVALAKRDNHEALDGIVQYNDNPFPTVDISSKRGRDFHKELQGCDRFFALVSFKPSPICFAGQCHTLSKHGIRISKITDPISPVVARIRKIGRYVSLISAVAFQ
jgi:hypothetical protein